MAGKKQLVLCVPASYLIGNQHWKKKWITTPPVVFGFPFRISRVNAGLTAFACYPRGCSGFWLPFFGTGIFYHFLGFGPL